MSGFKYGKYMELGWDCDPDWELVRGHVSREKAIKEFKAFGIEVDESDVIRHGFVRYIPITSRGWDGEYWLAENGRGAFPVTIMRRLQ